MGKVKKFKEMERGALILETSLVLPIFILLIAFLYGIFVIVLAQNVVSHALIQATDSLALDAYLNEQVNSFNTLTESYNGLSDAGIDIVRMGNDPYFSSIEDEVSVENARKRFIGYLSGGDEQLASTMLKQLSVVDGLSGMVFQTEKNGENLTIIVSYEIQYCVDFGGLGKIPMKQKMTAQLWS